MPYERGPDGVMRRMRPPGWGNETRRRQAEQREADRNEARLAASQWPPRKEEAACCLAHLDRHGRFPLGFCSDDCERRPEIHAARLRR